MQSAIPNVVLIPQRLTLVEKYSAVLQCFPLSLVLTLSLIISRCSGKLCRLCSIMNQFFHSSLFLSPLVISYHVGYSVPGRIGVVVSLSNPNTLTMLNIFQITTGHQGNRVNLSFLLTTYMLLGLVCISKNVGFSFEFFFSADCHASFKSWFNSQIIKMAKYFSIQ